jgi:hypothetical protein
MGEESDEENKYLEEFYLNRDLYEKTRDYDCDSLKDCDDYLNSCLSKVEMVLSYGS